LRRFLYVLYLNFSFIIIVIALKDDYD